MKYALGVLIAASALGAAAFDSDDMQAQEVSYDGQIYSGTNWWVQRWTTVHGYSGEGAAQYDLRRGYGVYVEAGPLLSDGIWWAYARGWGWIRADDLGYEQYIPPPPPVVQSVAPRPPQQAPVASGAAPVATPRAQPVPSTPVATAVAAAAGAGGVEGALRTYFGDAYGWAKCVVNKESGGNPGAVSPGGTYVGLFQIDWRLHGHSPEALKDPYYNAMVARQLYNASGTSPWPITRQGC